MRVRWPPARRSSASPIAKKIWRARHAKRSTGSPECRRPHSNEPEVAQAAVAAVADNQVVVHGHAERGGGLDNVLGYRDVGLRGGGIARGVVVHQDQGGRSE